MNWILTIALVLVVTATVSAQDLDSPRLGTTASVSDVRDPNAPSDLFSLMMARLAAAEAEFVDSRRSQDWEHLWEWGRFNMQNYEMGIFYLGIDLQTELSPAEFAGFQAAVRESAARLSAVGLN